MIISLTARIAVGKPSVQAKKRTLLNFYWLILLVYSTINNDDYITCNVNALHVVNGQSLVQGKKRTLLFMLTVLLCIVHGEVPLFVR